ncbi:hypothetical protein VP01_587g2 [Puccinia sorghi]|uniref:Uncharacterized protein n=1 Tax=Puccinia sorghi TaxID=27349 RepID=A0A0L6UJZ5_9BASI|nr:hypothetical protein VP01_587g2 [Puccinia sorghi]
MLAQGQKCQGHWKRKGESVAGLQIDRAGTAPADTLDELVALVLLFFRIGFCLGIPASGVEMGLGCSPAEKPSVPTGGQLNDDIPPGPEMGTLYSKKEIDRMTDKQRQWLNARQNLVDWSTYDLIDDDSQHFNRCWLTRRIWPVHQHRHRLHLLQCVSIPRLRLSIRRQTTDLRL